MMISRSLFKLCLLLIGLQSACGCRSTWPWSVNPPGVAPSRLSSSSRSADPTPEEFGASTASFVAQASNLSTEPASGPGATAEVTSQEAFAQILGDLQEIAEMDPGAQPILLKQLESEKPSLWPLMVKQYKAALAYRLELEERSQESAAWPSGEAQPPRIPPREPALGHPTRGRVEDAEPVGRLGDPRKTRAVLRQNPIEAALLEEAAASRGPRGGVQQVSFALPADSSPSGVEPRDWNESLEQAIEELAERLEEPPESTEQAYQHARLRLLQLAAGRPEEAARPIPGLSTIEQDYWAKQLYAIATLWDTQAQADQSRRARAASVHQASASDKLGELASLAVLNLSFCKDVYGFGALEPYDKPHFTPGQHVLLYAEVENYRSVSTEEGYHTSLGTSYEILDSNGTRVDGGEFPTVDDYCLRHRRDFHIQYGVNMPHQIYPGRYRLKLTIKDHLSSKLGHATLDFEIVGSH